MQLDVLCPGRDKPPSWNRRWPIKVRQDFRSPSPPWRWQWAQRLVPGRAQRRARAWASAPEPSRHTAMHFLNTTGPSDHSPTSSSQPPSHLMNAQPARFYLMLECDCICERHITLEEITHHRRSQLRDNEEAAVMTTPSCQEVTSNYIDHLRAGFECSPSRQILFSLLIFSGLMAKGDGDAGSA